MASENGTGKRTVVSLGRTAGMRAAKAVLNQEEKDVVLVEGGEEGKPVTVRPSRSHSMEEPSSPAMLERSASVQIPVSGTRDEEREKKMAAIRAKVAEKKRITAESQERIRMRLASSSGDTGAGGGGGGGGEDGDSSTTDLLIARSQGISLLAHKRSKSNTGVSGGSSVSSLPAAVTRTQSLRGGNSGSGSATTPPSARAPRAHVPSLESPSPSRLTRSKSQNGAELLQGAGRKESVETTLARLRSMPPEKVAVRQHSLNVEEPEDAMTLFRRSNAAEIHSDDSYIESTTSEPQHGGARFVSKLTKERTSPRDRTSPRALSEQEKAASTGKLQVVPKTADSERNASLWASSSSGARNSTGTTDASKKQQRKSQKSSEPKPQKKEADEEKPLVAPLKKLGGWFDAILLFGIDNKAPQQPAADATVAAAPPPSEKPAKVQDAGLVEQEEPDRNYPSDGNVEEDDKEGPRSRGASSSSSSTKRPSTPVSARAAAAADGRIPISDSSDTETRGLRKKSSTATATAAHKSLNTEKKVADLLLFLGEANHPMDEKVLLLGSILLDQAQMLDKIELKARRRIDELEARVAELEQGRNK